MRLTVENIEEWKELLNRAAQEKMDIENFSDTQTDEEWLYAWSGFHYADAIAEEMSCWDR